MMQADHEEMRVEPDSTSGITRGKGGLFVKKVRQPRSAAATTQVALNSPVQLLVTTCFVSLQTRYDPATAIGTQKTETNEKRRTTMLAARCAV